MGKITTEITCGDCNWCIHEERNPECDPQEVWLCLSNQGPGDPIDPNKTPAENYQAIGVYYFARKIEEGVNMCGFKPKTDDIPGHA